ncbi:MAG: cyclic nucleotide-binding domain-containing protein, partial [Chlorobiaceae bacterium]|nr:cyclic nucleotide-binding domain-containing protein [Chlorobiaceae bacterium]
MVKTVENSSSDIRKVIADNPLFANLGQDKIEKLAKSCTLAQFSIGKPVISKGTVPDTFYVLCSGKVRTLYQDSSSGAVQTLRLLGAGDVFGWVTLMRRQPTEIVTASEDTLCLLIPSASINAIVNDIPSLYDKVVKVTDPSEICALLELHFAADPASEQRLRDMGFSGIKDLAMHLFTTAETVDTGFTKKIPAKNLKWLVSRSSDPGYKPGSEYIVSGKEIAGTSSLRLIGLDFSFMKETAAADQTPASVQESVDEAEQIRSGRKESKKHRNEFSFSEEKENGRIRSKGFSFFKGKGIVEETLACFQMLGNHLNVPVKKDLIRSIVGNQLSRNGQISMQDCGGVGVVMGMSAQIVNFEQDALPRLKTPALIRWNESFAIIYQISHGKVVLASPAASGIKVYRLSEFWKRWENKGEALVLDVREDTPDKKFGFGWFAPSIKKYRFVLGEVMIASFFTQIMTLVNPLLFMIIIDQVIVRNSYSTLHVLGLFMVIIAVLQAVLNSLRTYLFVDTTNRIDVALGAEVIDHMLRLPLRFFEKRPVGELSSRIGELERIRQFLTGTALGVVLDA